MTTPKRARITMLKPSVQLLPDRVGKPALSAHTAGQFSHMYAWSRWRKLRARQLQAEPLCCMCRAEGRTALATICDHVEPHRGDMTKFWSGPFQSLCKQHHDSHKQMAERSGREPQRIGVDGWPIPSGGTARET